MRFSTVIMPSGRSNKWTCPSGCQFGSSQVRVLHARLSCYPPLSAWLARVWNTSIAHPPMNEISAIAPRARTPSIMAHSTVSDPSDWDNKSAGLFMHASSTGCSVSARQWMQLGHRTTPSRKTELQLQSFLPYHKCHVVSSSLTITILRSRPFFATLTAGRPVSRTWRHRSSQLHSAPNRTIRTKSALDKSPLTVVHCR